MASDTLAPPPRSGGRLGMVVGPQQREVSARKEVAEQQIRAQVLNLARRLIPSPDRLLCHLPLVLTVWGRYGVILTRSVD